MKILSAWLIATCLSLSALAVDSNVKIIQFAQSPKWLGHFFYSSGQSKVESSSYFLDPEGSKNPLKELQAAISFLTRTSDFNSEHYCRYISRFELILEFFPEYKKPFHICNRFESWNHSLSIDQVRL